MREKKKTSLISFRMNHKSTRVWIAWRTLQLMAVDCYCYAKSSWRGSLSGNTPILLSCDTRQRNEPQRRAAESVLINWFTNWNPRSSFEVGGAITFGLNGCFSGSFSDQSVISPALGRFFDTFFFLTVIYRLVKTQTIRIYHKWLLTSD